MREHTAIIARELVDLDAVAAWMDSHRLGEGPLAATKLLSGGTQNILLYFERSGRPYVLRRPPRHLRANSNDTMRREARVLAALAGSDVPHPPLIAACPQEDVIGTAFYLMEPIDGFNPTTGLPEPHRSDPDMRYAMGFEMVDGIVRLGRIDYRAVGLEGFGKPEGFLERQVDRWRSQLESYSRFDGYPGPQIPGVNRIARWLSDNRPTTFEPGILHGDYHLANVMFAYGGPQLAAIVDWELCTVGDPLLDLGWLVATWADEDGASAATLGVTPWDGFPTAAELVAHYDAQSERDLSAIAWYSVLACYKLGIILEGTHARACAGIAEKGVGDMLHATTVGLFQRALRWTG
jgi:aminoglycoside phosphotransferase (APT) family kinase protein